MKFVLDPANPPRLDEGRKARLLAMTDEEITAAAMSDPDNLPLTDDEVARFQTVRALRDALAATCLDVATFADRFGIDAGLINELQTGQVAADGPTYRLLAIAAEAPELALHVAEGVAGYRTAA